MSKAIILEHLTDISLYRVNLLRYITKSTIKMHQYFVVLSIGRHLKQKVLQKQSRIFDESS